MCILIKKNSDVPEEGYRLNITKKYIDIQASTEKGVLYAFETLKQAWKEDVDLVAPVCYIEDEPLFKWRGILLDVARHFFDVKSVKKVMKIMAMHKLNTIHLHLTDDQGWRIQIDKYPKLIEIGSKREGYGPFFFTKEQIKELIVYGRKKNIEIIPEIDIPSHTLAAVASYPELACVSNTTLEVSGQWGSKLDGLCPGKPAALRFIKDVFDEVIELFPNKYVHIGGDEAMIDRWVNSTECQELMKEKGFTEESELYKYFVDKVRKHIEKRGKTVIGWDEIINSNLSPTMTVMSWHGADIISESVKRGYDVVACPNLYLYFDKKQLAHDRYTSIRGIVTLRRAYSLNPLKNIPEELTHKVIGVQGDFWSEYIENEEQLLWKMSPRLSALAEIGWTVKENRDWMRFYENVKEHMKRLDRMGIPHAPVDPVPLFTWEKSNVNNNNEWRTMEWNATGEFTRVENYSIQFRVSDGEAVKVKDVTLRRSDTNEVFCYDGHTGYVAQSGLDYHSRANIFHFTLVNWTKFVPLTFSAKVMGPGSAGEVYVDIINT